MRYREVDCAIRIDLKPTKSLPALDEQYCQRELRPSCPRKKSEIKEKSELVR
jgi:hypothetical protein